uniref:Uncharacterized protein LOC100177518 n=1 Tax=Phallusia mammillata TaxID=59560 RepID=A0A6F9DHC7_9ASCI|nr:uncharacterized protein LOC100177518 [Phallusia mammillata]
MEAMRLLKKMRLSFCVWLAMTIAGTTVSSAFEAERPYDPCIINPCENNCTCELANKFETNRYRCMGSKEKCTWKALEVQCNNDAIRVTLPAWLVTLYALKHDVTMDDITSALYVSSQYQPDENNCKAFANTTKAGETQYSLILLTTFTNCDTMTRIVGESPEWKVIVTNQVWFEKTVADFYGYPVKLVNISCLYPIDFIMKTLLKPICCQPQPFNTTNGNLGVEMTLGAEAPNKNGIMTSALGLPLSYMIGQELFVTLELTEDSEFNLTLLDCYVSPHFTVGKDFDTVDIIKDRCPSRSIHFRHEITENGIGKRTVFMFQVFKLGEAADFYIHCHALLCNEDCVPKCTQNRTRWGRSFGDPLSSLKKSSLILQRDFTTGPVHVRTKRTAKKRKQNPTPQKPPKSDQAFSWMIPTLLAFSNLTCVALLGALCYALARSVSSRRNQRLRDSLHGTPVSDLFLRRDNQSTCATETVQLLSVNPQFDYAKKCTMLTPPTSPSTGTAAK